MSQCATALTHLFSSFVFYCSVDHRDLHVLTHSFPPRRSSDLPLLTPVVVRRAYNTVGPDVLTTEWKLDGGPTGKADGVALPLGEPALRSTFEIGRAPV